MYGVKDPIEMAVKRYLPWMKALASIELHDKGKSESRIASSMGLTQPSVSLYLRRGREFYFEKLTEMGLDRDQVLRQLESYVSAFEKGDRDIPSACLQVVAEALGSVSLCAHHIREDGMPADCDACMRFFGSGGRVERARVLRELSEAIDLLQSSSTFPLLIPEVYTNFVSAMPEARTYIDVAGVAGRIARVMGKARALRRPEFGASRHVAGVLLTVKRRFDGIRSAMNVKYDGVISELMVGLGWRKLKLTLDPSAAGDLDMMTSSLEQALDSASGPPDVVFHEGGFGLEPSAYVFGGDPMEVVHKVLTLADMYASRRWGPRERA